MAKGPALPLNESNDPDVYHDHDDCPAGSQIPPKNWAAGTGEHRLCQLCISMD